MKRALHVLLAIAVLSSAHLCPRRALAAGIGADDAGDGGATDDAASRDDASDASSAAAVPIACDGSLCDTTNGATCGMSKWRGGGAPVDSTSVTALLGLLVLALARRRQTPAPGRSR
jgi:hypothetical protein